MIQLFACLDRRTLAHANQHIDQLNANVSKLTMTDKWNQYIEMINKMKNQSDELMKVQNELLFKIDDTVPVLNDTIVGEDEQLHNCANGLVFKLLCYPFADLPIIVIAAFLMTKLGRYIYI